MLVMIIFTRKISMESSVFLKNMKLLKNTLKMQSKELNHMTTEQKISKLTIKMKKIINTKTNMKH